MNRVEPAHVPGCFKMFKTTGTHRELPGRLSNTVGWLVLLLYVPSQQPTAMVIAGRSVHLTTLFPGQA